MHGGQIIAKLALQIALHAIGLNDLTPLHGTDVVLGIPSRQGAVAELDPELLARLFLPHIVRLLLSADRLRIATSALCSPDAYAAWPNERRHCNVAWHRDRTCLHRR